MLTNSNMKKVMMIVVMVAAVALPAMAGWITAGNQQDPSKNQEAFQSTSTMQGSGSTYTANPVLNEDGTAAAPTERSSGPRRAKMGDDDDIGGYIVTPGKTGSEAPIGDAVLPLMLMAVAGAGVIALRRRKAAVGK